MKAVWEGIKRQIGSELPKNSFSLWINPITFLAKNGKTIILGCPNKFSRKWVMENYLALIQDKFHTAGETHLDLLFKVDTRETQDETSSEMPYPKQLLIPTVPINGKPPGVSLNRQFTFDKFIVGPANEFAYSASHALADGDPWHYQSLLMLANTGLGKTHLSQAIGHEVLLHNPQTRVYYMTAENFTNEMISSLKNNTIEKFKNKYRRSCDLLLLEEIHFLSGKEKTQAELAYTLDALANDNKKIIFTSSLPPKDIPRISKELSSRLTSGLVTTIGGPDYETRVKILTKKAAANNMALSKEIIHLLATHLKRDIRQMESALKCLKAKSELLSQKMNPALAKDVISCLVSRESSLTLEEIRDLVSKYYKVEQDMLSSRSRKRTYAYPRNIYIYLCRRHTDQTIENIAKTVNRSHSTVLYATEVTEHKMKTDHRMRHEINFLSQKLQNM